MDITASLFGLLKNNGFFKSEKQANFLTKFLADDLTYYTSFNYNLGSEYNFKSCGSASFTFFCDSTGVLKVEKTTSTNKVTTYFQRVSDKDHKDKLARIAKEKEEYATARKTLDLMIARQDKLRLLCEKIISYTNIKAFKDQGLDKSTIIALKEMLLKGSFTHADFNFNRDKLLNTDKRFTCIYNEYSKQVERVNAFNLPY